MSVEQFLEDAACLNVKVGRLAGGYIAIDTYDNVVANYPASNFENKVALASGITADYTEVVAKNGKWITRDTLINIPCLQVGYLLIGGSGGTYSQVGNLVTVTWTAHGITSMFNGASAHLTISTGSALTGFYSDFTYVDANTFTVVSSVSQTTSGNLGANTTETFLPTQYTFHPDLLYSGVITIPIAIYTGVNSSVTKTFKTYFGGQSIANAQTLGVTTSFGVYSPSSQYLQSDTTFFSVAGPASLLTLVDTTYKFSMQVSSATGWAYYSPIRISYNRIK